jgi:hypothetical protein
VACYLGLASLLWFSGASRQQNPLLKHHLLYSLAFSFLTIWWFVFFVVLNAAIYVIYVYLWGWKLSAGTIEFLEQSVTWVENVISLVTVIAMIAWIVSLVAAWRGRRQSIPFISRISTNQGAIRLSVYWTLMLDVLFIILVFISARSARIVNTSAEKADVYVLYTVGGYIPTESLYTAYTPPRWTIAVAFYPLLRAGMEKWGDQSVSILPLSEGSFNEAIQNGRFVFVASHGGSAPGSFTISYNPYQSFSPFDVRPGTAGERLQYVYFGGCDTGDLRADWEQVLAPSEIKSFDRVSFVSEHLLWVWFKSPGVIERLN